MAVPYTFATATSSIPLSQLDSNFATAITLGSTALYLGNTTTSVAGLTLTGATLGGTFSGTSVTDSGLTSGRVTYAGTGGLLQDSANLTFNGTTLTAGGLSGPHNGTVGATTPSTGAFTTLSSSGATTLASGGVTIPTQFGALAAPSTLTASQQVFNGASIWTGQTTVGGETDFGWNFYYNGGFKSRLADVASRLSFNATSGRVSFWTAANPGSADAALTFTEALRIDATTGVTALGAMSVGNGLAVTGTLSSTGNAALSTSSGGVSTIGTSTPSAWATGNYKGIEINGGASFIGYVGNQQTYMASNLYNDGTNWRYIGTAGAALYGNFGIANGSHVWYGAGSGTAGSVATLTTLMAVEPNKSLALQGATSQTGTGITFPATQSASSDANTLDDYEEGTWTPTLNFGGASTGITYSVQSGTYTKIGNLVFVVCRIALTSKGTATGAVSITNAPFTGPAVSGSGAGSGTPFYWSTFNTTGPGTVINYQATFAPYTTNTTSITGMTDANFNNNTSLYFSCTYYV